MGFGVWGLGFGVWGLGFTGQSELSQDLLAGQGLQVFRLLFNEGDSGVGFACEHISKGWSMSLGC